MTYRVITPPTLLNVVTLAELRLHTRMDVTDADTALQLALAGAHGHAEHYTQTSIGAQVLELALDRFPAGGIELPRGPVVSITSVKYTDEAGAEITIDPSAYSLDDYAPTAWLMPAYGTTWPATLPVANAVRVRYAAGRDATAPAVKSALLLMTGHLFNNPDGVASGNLAELPLGIQSLLDTVKVWSM